jgi:large subunit ribosomal protein L35
MPKLKTNSSTKKRFKISKNGKIIRGQAGKRHGMIKRSNNQIRDHRGTALIDESDAAFIIKQFMPYSKKNKKRR